MWSPATTIAASVEKARAAGIADRRSAPRRLVEDSPRWCSRRACRSPIRSRTGRSGSRAAPASRSSATSSCSAASGARIAPDCAVRRHHRHQRQVDHHGADRASPAQPPAATRSSAAISARAILTLEPPRAEPRPCDRVLVLPDRSRAVARSARRHPAQRHARTISTATARWRTTPRSRSGWSPACRPTARRSSASTTTGARRSADRLERAGKRVDPHLGAPAAARRHLCRGRRDHARRRRQRREPIARPRRHRLAARRAQCAERRLRGRGRRSRSGSTPAAIQDGLALVSRPRAPHGAGRPQGHGAVRQQFQGDQRGFGGAGAGLASPTSSGSPAASRRPAASPRSPDSSRASRKAYLIGEAAADFAATLDGKVPYEIAGTLDARGRARPRATRRRRG